MINVVVSGQRLRIIDIGQTPEYMMKPPKEGLVEKASRVPLSFALPVTFHNIHKLNLSWGNCSQLQLQCRKLMNINKLKEDIY